MKTSPRKLPAKISWGRYILIVGAALILAILLYTLLDKSDRRAPLGEDSAVLAKPENEAVTGIEPASFLEITEFQEGGAQRLRLSGKAEAGAVVVITNKGERLRQVGVNELGQWALSLNVEPGLMVLKAQLYVEDDAPVIRSEETVFRLGVPETQTGSDEDNNTKAQTPPAAAYKTSALIMVTAPGSPSRVIQSPFGESPTAGPLSLTVIDYDHTGGIIITGTSSVPGRVRLYAQNTVIGETGIGVGGRWNFIAGRMLPRAKIILSAELIPAPGALNPPPEPSRISIPFNFIPPLKEEDTDGSGALSVNIESQQWQIRRTLIGGGGQSTVVFSPGIELDSPEDDQAGLEE